MIMQELSGPQVPTDFVRPPIPIVIASGESVARAENLEAAVTLVVAEARRVLGVRAFVVQRTDRGWATVAARDDAGPPDLRILAIDAALESLAPGGAALVSAAEDAATWTAASLRIAGGLPLAVVVEGDWTQPDSILTTWAAVVAFAVDAVRRDDERRRAARKPLAAYAAARRLGRLGRVRTVCQKVVEHVALLLDAERVSLAVYRPADHSLSIEAAVGYPISSVENVRIQPGTWVMGHVFSSGRPLYVRDVRQLQGAANAAGRYRTHSFAAIPLFANAEVVGVLAVTDKKDGSPLAASDMLTLRFAAAIAVLAIVAARSRDEAGRLTYAATVDALTGLHNRPYLDERLHEEVERARRNGASLAVLMADVDDFKLINDTYGHQRGDAVLKVVGGILRTSVRVFDICARYGGDEFAILMPSSDARDAAACAERIRRRVEECKGDELTLPLPPITMSIGVAVAASGESTADLILRADRSLYEAKAAGKNRVRVYVGTSGRRAQLVERRHDQEPM